MSSKTSDTKAESAVVAPRIDSQALASATALATEAPAPFSPQALADAAGTVAGLATQLSADPVPVTAASADNVDELERGGPAFGKFLKSVGLAVAETQAALDQTLVQTAKALSETKIEVAAVFEQEINDDGTMGTGTIHKQELPLISYLMPTAYAFSQVYLTADMEVSEFNTANGLNIKKSHVGAKLDAEARYGMLKGFSGEAKLSAEASHDSSNELKSSSEDKAVGKLHMEATLEPRTDIQLPRPFVVQKGPRLRLLVTGREELDAGGKATTDPKLVVSRKVTLKAVLVAKDGKPLVGTLDVNCDGGFPFETSSATTDATNGELTITVRRTGLTPENAAPVNTVVRASMNMVTAAAPISI